MLSKEASSTIFGVFDMTRPGDWTQVSRAIGEHSNHYANALYYLWIAQYIINQFINFFLYIYNYQCINWDAGGLIIIRTEIGISKPGSDYGRGCCIHFTLIPLGMVWIHFFFPQLRVKYKENLDPLLYLGQLM